jgi:3-phenylpropionate/cinnamic acid dioxygenase small subunit
MTPTDLVDLRAIEAVYVRYCEIVDAKAFDAMEEVFTADATGDYTQALGPGVISPNRASLIASMHRNLGPGSLCGATHHNVGNFRITLAGDTAHAVVNYHAVHRGTGRLQGALYTMWGHYDDDLVRTPDGWRVAARRYSCSLSEGPVVTMAEAAA